VAHGGAREGAGRKRGAAARLDAEARAKAMEGLTPLDYMLGILRDEENEAAVRMDAAKAAAPYVHARLASVEANVEGKLGVTVEIVRFGGAK
jgi:hypothetical protein